MSVPFADQAELVTAHIERIHDRAMFALLLREQEAKGERPPKHWPRELLDAEAALAARTEATIAAGVELPIMLLQERLLLVADELRVIWVLLAHELSPVVRGLLRQLSTENTADPTIEAVRTVALGTGTKTEASRLFGPRSVLVSSRLIERTDGDRNGSEHRETWKVSRRVLALAHGDTEIDASLHGIAEPIDPTTRAIGIGGGGIETDPATTTALTIAFRTRAAGGAIVVKAPRGTGRRTLLHLHAIGSGLRLLELDVEKLTEQSQADPARARERVVALGRDCRLFQRVPLLRNVDALARTGSTDQDAPAAPTVTRELVELLKLHLDGMLVLATAADVVPRDLFAAPTNIEPRPITTEQRARLWRRALPSISEATARDLATVYPVSPSVIDAAATVARVQIEDGHAEALRPVRLGLRAVLDGRLAEFATRVEPKQTADLLVLPVEQQRQLDEIIIRMQEARQVYEDWDMARHVGRGLGLSALFSGPPGTGKTMAASIIAERLGVDLYIVDTSRITSKWVGETEKNLARVFDAAEETCAVLLFDEAEGMYGKRTSDIKTSTDRHANQETGYLLRRLDAFRGICILTTNHANALDEAFKRRLTIHVEFPMPEEKERAELWRKAMRATLPTSGPIDFNSLAKRYEMSGAHIKNAVVRAAFFAAHDKKPITYQHLELAAQREYHALGRITPSSGSSL